ncbi:hypothetical protein GCM10023189_10680 [Nibrella saemangeumensis]|uniref:Tetratricopeptide repeat protein n=1 Tax=Nibrella saemangeumensis TaxID=1084526 RepID=A0ABP8MJ28_9BACT
MNKLERIDDYFNGRLTADEKQGFESSLQTDPDLADAVAFYLMARQAAKAESREQRLTQWNDRRQTVPARRISLWPYTTAAAACLLLLLGLGWYFFTGQNQPPTATELADTYITQKYNQLPASMSGSADSLALGVNAYRKQQYTKADSIFSALLESKPDYSDALKYAGIVSLRTGNYDKAITHFNRLNQQTELLDTSGLILEALAYIKRGQPMDKNQAKKLLQTVIDKNLEGKQEAVELLKHL